MVSAKFKDLKQLAILLAVLVLVNLLSLQWFARIDFTKEKRYTLSPLSKNLMDSLPGEVHVAIYLQSNNLPAGFKRLQGAARDMLEDMQAYSHGKLKFILIDPLAGLNEQQQTEQIQTLQNAGIEATNLSVKTDDGLSQKIIFPQAVVAAGDKQVVVQLLQNRIGLSPEDVLNNSIQNLEYAFASAIKKAINGGRQQIGFTEGHGELSDLQLKDAITALSDGFQVGRVDLNAISFTDLLKIKMLVIDKPEKPFTEAEKFKVDQYLMRGGKLVYAIDQVSAELDSLRGHGGEQLAFNKQLNLDDQLFVYGARVNYDLIADMNCAQIPIAAGNVGSQADIQMVPWLFYPVFVPTAKHPLVKNLEGIRSEFASTIDTLAIKGVRKTVLLTSSPYNRKFRTPYTMSLQMLQQVPNPKTFMSDPKTVGVLLEGVFKSDFRNRAVPPGITERIGIVQQSLPTKIIVLSDGDLFKNQVSTDGSAYPLGYDHYSQQNFGNKNLLLNIADYMSDGSGLIDLRSKEIQLRLLDKARTRAEKTYWQLINNLLPVLLVLIFAIFQHYLRNRKYAH